jgi:hypothetical protein
MLPEASHPKAGQIGLSRTGWSSRCHGANSGPRGAGRRVQLRLF